MADTLYAELTRRVREAIDSSELNRNEMYEEIMQAARNFGVGMHVKGESDYKNKHTTSI